MSSSATAFPLQWPAIKPRTAVYKREAGRFSVGQNRYGTDSFGRTTYSGKKPITMVAARDRLAAELERLGANYVVLSTNVELRLDGQPYANRAEPVDPGVAVYFQLRGKPFVFACDQYTKVPANIAAIAAHIDAMRTAERHGVGTLEQMFAGFTALPGAMAPQDWRVALGEPKTLPEAEANYRERIKTAHPDVSGDDGKRAIVLNAAIAAAREALK